MVGNSDAQSYLQKSKFVTDKYANFEQDILLVVLQIEIGKSTRSK